MNSYLNYVVQAEPREYLYCVFKPDKYNAIAYEEIISWYSVIFNEYIILKNTMKGVQSGPNKRSEFSK